MVQREVGWLCALCEGKGHRAPVFRKWHGLVKHSEQVHAGRGAKGVATVEVAARRVWL